MKDKTLAGRSHGGSCTKRIPLLGNKRKGDSAEKKPNESCSPSPAGTIKKEEQKAENIIKAIEFGEECYQDGMKDERERVLKLINNKMRELDMIINTSGGTLDIPAIRLECMTRRQELRSLKEEL